MERFVLQEGRERSDFVCSCRSAEIKIGSQENISKIRREVCHKGPQRGSVCPVTISIIPGIIITPSLVRGITLIRRHSQLSDEAKEEIFPKLDLIFTH